MILFTIDCYNRYDHLLLSLERLMSFFPEEKFACFLNDRIPDGIPSSVTVLHTHENSGHHNGTKDACNAFLPLITEDITHVVRMHADSHPIDLSDIRKFINLTDDATIITAMFQPGDFNRVVLETGELRLTGIHIPSSHEPMPYFNCHFWTATANAYKKFLPLTIDCDGNGHGASGALEDGFAIGIEVSLGVACVRAGIKNVGVDIKLVTANDYNSARKELGI